MNDAITVTRPMLIESYKRAHALYRAWWPDAKIGWYAFPTGSYWTGDEIAEDSFARWFEPEMDAFWSDVDVILISAYDHYSHLFQFPYQTDAQFASDQLTVAARDERQWRRFTTMMRKHADDTGLPLWAYTRDSFHPGGRCDKAGWLIPDAEYKAHIVGNLVGIDGIILWGAREFYYTTSECNTTNIDTQSGCAGDIACFRAWNTEASHNFCRLAVEAVIEKWGP